ncbi:MAG: KR domain-containing protein, partial [Dolichospermum sp.]
SPIIQSWGHITGVIHGAGNLADKRLEKKTLADWQRVVTPKIIGLQNLLSVLDVARLKYLILFSSVSAYFGNAGQTDYALANEILNKFAYSCQSLYPGLQVTSINWGPWEKGMMNSVLQKYYQAQGIELISVATGTRLLREELEIGQTHRSQQILISGSLSLPDNYYTRRQEESSYLRDLQAVYNPFLNDHKVGDELVLPLT